MWQPWPAEEGEKGFSGAGQEAAGGRGSGDGSRRELGAGRRGGEAAGRQQGLRPAPAWAAPRPAQGAPVSGGALDAG